VTESFAAEGSSPLEGVMRAMRRRRLAALSVPVLLVAYLAYVFVAFDVAGLAERARLDNAALLLRDSWSHKVHVTRDLRTGEDVVSVEGERRGTYAPGDWPDWVEVDGGATRVALPQGHAVAFAADGTVTYEAPGERRW
jgi:phosphonate transport system permease protein